MLILGGEDASGLLSSTEIYDPETGGFTAGPSLTTARTGARAFLLDGARVLLVGGTNAAAPAEVVDADGTAVSAEFTFAGDLTDTIGRLRDEIDAAFPGSTVTLDTSDNFVVTSDTKGEANMSLTLSDDSLNTGATAWENHPLGVSTEGKGPDTVTASIVVFDVNGQTRTITLTFERLESNPRFATVARPANATVVTKLRIDMDDRGGRLELFLPYATLEPVRELLLQGFIGEKFGRDSIWESHLAGELWHTDLSIQAVLDQVEVPLGDVLSWARGSRLDLNCEPNSKVQLRCGDNAMFDGNMGRRGNNIAVRITEKLFSERT